MNLKCHVNSFSIRLLLPATSEQIDLISFKINSHTEARLWNWALSHRRAMYHLVYKWFYLRSNSKIFMWNKLRHKSSLHTQEMLLLAEHFEYKCKELESFACCQERERKKGSQSTVFRGEHDFLSNGRTVSRVGQSSSRKNISPRVRWRLY